MTECLRCGKCCHFVEMNLPGIITPDMARYLSFRGIQLLPHHRVRFPLRCEHLFRHPSEIMENGEIKSVILNSCAIYSCRPEICRREQPGSWPGCPLYKEKNRG